MSEGNMKNIIVEDFISGDAFECQWHDDVFAIASYEDDTVNDLVHKRTGFAIDRYSSKQVCINLAKLIQRTFCNIDDILNEAAIAYRDKKPYTTDFLLFCKWGENKRNHESLIPSKESKVILHRE